MVRAPTLPSPLFLSLSSDSCHDTRTRSHTHIHAHAHAHTHAHTHSHTCSHTHTHTHTGLSTRLMKETGRLWLLFHSLLLQPRAHLDSSTAKEEIPLHAPHPALPHSL